MKKSLSNIREEMVNVSAVAGTGDPRLSSDQREPGVKKGKFAGKTTFKLPREIYNKFNVMSKKDRKWWSKYLGEDDDFISHIREYANKNPKKPIIFECEDTGYCFFARYGKE